MTRDIILGLDQPPQAKRSLLCWIGIHSWQLLRVYRQLGELWSCRRCTKAQWNR